MKKISWVIATIALVLFAVSAVRLISGRTSSSNHTSAESELPSVPIGSQAEAPSSSDESMTHPLIRWGFDLPQGDFTAIDFEVETLSGEYRRLEDYSGNLFILNFWATWCPPCREEIPSMERMMEELGGSGIALLAISSMEERGTVEAYVEEQSMTLSVALDESGEIGTLYGVQNIPTTYLIDGEGKFIARKRGGMEWDDPELIRQILLLN